MYTALFVLHLLIAVLLCLVVLLQQSKGNGLAGAFGGAGAGEAFFGARGVTTILHKATIYLGAAFMITSVFLVLMSGRGSSGNLSQRAADQLPDAQPLPAATIPADGGTMPLATPIDDDATGDGATGGDDAASGDAPATSDAPVDEEGGSQDDASQ